LKIQIKAADLKISLSSRISRRKRRGEKRKREEPTTTTYFPGAFGTSKTPEFDIDGDPQIKKKKVTAKKRVAPVNQREQPTESVNEDAIEFDIC